MYVYIYIYTYIYTYIYIYIYIYICIEREVDIHTIVYCCQASPQRPAASTAT